MQEPTKNQEEKRSKGKSKGKEAPRDVKASGVGTLAEDRQCFSS